MRSLWFTFVLMLTVVVVRAERINHEGRILGPLLSVTNAALFNTPQADAVLSSMQIFPVDNPWNEDISRRPVLSNSAAMITQIITDLGSHTNLRAFSEMNFVLVPTNQPLVPIDLIDYPDESDLGPYPIPSNLPIEEWPVDNGGYDLMTWQTNDDGSDRHAIIVQPGTGKIWETWRTVRVGTNWEAACGALFNFTNNNLRAAGYTSGDAGGLSMFPALVRYDECERGMVEHAVRLVVKRSRKEYIYPARHYAGSTTSATVPAMGQRMRLKASFNITTNYTKEEKAVLLGLKKYGAIVADNGNFFSISVTPDDRYPANCFNHLSSISITNFEVIDTTTQTGGPRSPGAPVASAGADFTVAKSTPVTLRGFVTVFANTPPSTNAWKVYAGPGNVIFDDPSRTNATATFTNSGTYTLMLSSADGVHAVAYDAVVVTVGAAPIAIHTATSGKNITMSWSGGSPPYVVEQNSTLGTTNWTVLTTTNATSITIPVGNGSRYYRVRQGP